MPTGRTHDRITLTSLPVVGGSTLWVSHSTRLTLIVCASFLFSGLMFGPDLDIYSCQFRRWGWLRWLWLPYQKLLRHRSLFSHGPVIGTLFRLLYLAIWLLLLGSIGLSVAIYSRQVAWDWRSGIELAKRYVQQYPFEGLALLIGLELGAMSHYLSDWGGSVYKRLKQSLTLKSKR
ncbi:MAG: metal-binding protein [Aphanocapsa sp. GSE-SYN-MK-11-07L]|jgi:uncharacterized metal-binding protein|nr:metal-binding protein [Aphanocapsa sp. GSE-SYN-MK-11-07L]